MNSCFPTAETRKIPAPLSALRPIPRPAARFGPSRQREQDQKAPSAPFSRHFARRRPLSVSPSISGKDRGNGAPNAPKPPTMAEHPENVTPRRAEKTKRERKAAGPSRVPHAFRTLILRKKSICRPCGNGSPAPHRVATPAANAPRASSCRCRSRPAGAP